MVTKEYIQQWFNSSMQDRLKARNDLLQLVELYPYFELSHWMLCLIEEDPLKDWYQLRELSHLHPVMYTLELEYARNSPPIEVEKEKIAQEKLTKRLGDYFYEETQQMDHDLHAIAETFKISNHQEDFRPVKEDQSLMVVMTFAEWLEYLHNRSQQAAAEEESQKALRAMWQREKLAYHDMEEEEEIPEEVFNMALNSITLEEEIVSESMAHVYIKQEKWSQAIEIYNKLSLRNPEKSVYFAEQVKKIEQNLPL